MLKLNSNKEFLLGATDFDGIYSDQYTNLLDTGLVGKVQALTHVSLDKGVTGHYPLVLEVGAGKGQHLAFVKHTFEIYIESDIRIDTLKDATKNRKLTGLGTVEQVALNAENLDSIKPASVDRIVATCVLAHLRDPKRALEEFRRVLVPGGIASIYVPSEPGFILRLARYLSTVQKAKRLGYSHLPFHYQEHRNHFLNLKYVLLEVFSEDELRFESYPFRWASWNFSLWKIVRVRKSLSS